MPTENILRLPLAALCSRAVVGVSVAMAALLVAGCGASAPAADSQVAVRINKGEVTVHQVQAVLKRQPRLLAEQPAAASAKVLDVLVEQELAAQAATDKGLEREPDVVQALQLARREVLARAYQEQLAANVSGPSSDEVDRYYDAHPAVFAQRRLYMLQEFAVEATAEQASSLAALAKRAKSADEVGSLLREAGLKQRTRRFVQAAEDVPAVVLEPLSKLEKGQSLAMTQGAVPRIFTLLDVQSAPIERRQAADVIAGYLVSERKRQLVAPAMKALRDAAEIKYQGAFANAATAAAAPAANASAAN
jgi:EpsD family peptidyl-prolyl cis-trans isomerase